MRTMETTSEKTLQPSEKSEVDVDEPGKIQMLPLAKETKEKLMLLNDNYSRKLDKLMEEIETSTNTINSSVNSQEQYIHLKSIIGRIQLGIYNSHLLITLGEYLRLLEKRRGKLRDEAKQLSQENSSLRQSIQTLQGDIFREEAELTVAQEEMSHWMFMNNISKADAADALDNVTLDAWISTIFPEIRYQIANDREKTKMAENLPVGGIEEAERMIKEQVERQSVDSDRQAIELIWLARQYADRSMYDKAAVFINQALDLRRKIFGKNHENVVKVQNFLALIHWRNGKIRAAMQCAYEGLCSIEEGRNDIDNADIALQFLRVGYLLTKMEHVVEGVKAIEFSMRTFELLLPHEETNWLAAATSLIRVCNRLGAHVNALTLCCEVIDYFYETRFGKISSENIPIYEMAAWQQVCASTAIDLPPQPTPISLPEAMVGVIRELLIVFIQFYFFSGARVIDNWLDECTVVPPNLTHRLYHLEGVYRFNYAKDSEERKMKEAKLTYGKRTGWMEKALETVELRGFSLINTGDVLENWNQADFQKTRKHLHKKFHARVVEILKK